jgi:hypothetical protein
MGDGFTALFGLSEPEQEIKTVLHHAVQAGLAMLETMDALKPYLKPPTAEVSTCALEFISAKRRGQGPVRLGANVLRNR